MSKKLFHWRNDSGELDVFEAANYFAGSNDHQVPCHNNGPTFSHKLLREGCNNQAWRSGRMSLDMPVAIQLSSTPFGASSQMEKPAAGMKGKCKQPSSPGGKLASFLNSLFNQKNGSKKKKKKSKSAAVNDEDAHSPGGWMRRRRSSLSELYGRSSSNTAYNNAASSTSGFRTPPPYPNKSCKDNHKPENKVKFISSGISERRSVHHWADEYPSQENEERKFDDDDDGGADSDSSSDLFDLPNRELLDYYSTGLPVYQTTQMDTIKSGAPISATVQ